MVLYNTTKQTKAEFAYCLEHKDKQKFILTFCQNNKKKFKKKRIVPFLRLIHVHDKGSYNLQSICYLNSKELLTL